MKGPDEYVHDVMTMSRLMTSGDIDRDDDTQHPLLLRGAQMRHDPFWTRMPLQTPYRGSVIITDGFALEMNSVEGEIHDNAAVRCRYTVST